MGSRTQKGTHPALADTDIMRDIMRLGTKARVCQGYQLLFLFFIFIGVVGVFNVFIIAVSESQEQMLQTKSRACVFIHFAITQGHEQHCLSYSTIK